MLPDEALKVCITRVVKKYAFSSVTFFFPQSTIEREVGLEAWSVAFAPCSGLARGECGGSSIPGVPGVLPYPGDQADIGIGGQRRPGMFG
jgi:hypothetical protein